VRGLRGLLHDRHPPLWQRVGLTLAWTVPLGAIMALLLVDGTDEALGMIAVVVFAGLFYELTGL
jgi:hypothetical protein